MPLYPDDQVGYRDCASFYCMGIAIGTTGAFCQDCFDSECDEQTCNCDYACDCNCDDDEI